MDFNAVSNINDSYKKQYFLINVVRRCWMPRVSANGP